VNKYGGFNFKKFKINSLDYEVLETINGLVLKIIADDYLQYVDQGRRPGKRPPQRAILKWVENKNITIKKQTPSQTAFVIARSIGKKGIKPTNVLKKTQSARWITGRVFTK
jgi:hypothetical protein